MKYGNENDKRLFYEALATRAEDVAVKRDLTAFYDVTRIFRENQLPDRTDETPYGTMKNPTVQ